MMKMKMNFVSKKKILFFFLVVAVVFVAIISIIFNVNTFYSLYSLSLSLIKLDQQNNITYNRGQTVERPEIKHSK